MQMVEECLRASNTKTNRERCYAITKVNIIQLMYSHARRPARAGTLKKANFEFLFKNILSNLI